MLCPFARGLISDNLPGKKKMKSAANPPMRATAYPMSLTNTETMRERLNHTIVCMILRCLSCTSANAGGILKNDRYKPSRQLLQNSHEMHYSD